MLVVEPSVIASTPAVDLAFEIWDSQIRYLGVGAMLAGGIWALISMRSSLASSLRGSLSVTGHGSGTVPATERDTPIRLVVAGVVFLVVPMFLLYRVVAGSAGIGFVMAVIMLIAGFLFSAVAAYMAGLVGSSNNPISGITIATILFASLILSAIAGPQAPMGAAAAILIGGVVCCAAAIGGDNMQDLKAGYILGATPWKQQVMQFVGVLSAACVIAPILNLLLTAYGIGTRSPETPDALAAPQATLMAAVAGGVFGGDLPWTMIYTGTGIGIAIIVFDEILRKRGASFRAPVLAVAVGIYLPLELSVPIFAGGLISHAVSRIQPDGVPARAGMLVAAGLITGEALIGILMAIPIVVTGNSDVLAIGASLRPGLLLGLPVMALVAIGLYRAGAARE
jgi:putative OPT family oligopeptide transporter